jgi:hypothetical protein
METGIPPLLSRVQFQSDKYVLNQFRWQDNPIVSKLNHLNSLLTHNRKWHSRLRSPLIEGLQQAFIFKPDLRRSNSLPCFSFPFLAYSFPISYSIMPSPASCPDDRAGGKLFQEYCHSKWPHCSYHVFTDGSKSDNSVGAAFVIPHLSLSPLNSNFINMLAFLLLRPQRLLKLFYFSSELRLRKLSSTLTHAVSLWQSMECQTKALQIGISQL